MVMVMRVATLDLYTGHANTGVNRILWKFNTLVTGVLISTSQSSDESVCIYSKNKTYKLDGPATIYA